MKIIDRYIRYISLLFSLKFLCAVCFFFLRCQVFILFEMFIVHIHKHRLSFYLCFLFLFISFVSVHSLHPSGFLEHFCRFFFMLCLSVCMLLLCFFSLLTCCAVYLSTVCMPCLYCWYAQRNFGRACFCVKSKFCCISSAFQTNQHSLRTCVFVSSHCCFICVFFLSPLSAGRISLFCVLSYFCGILT